MRHGAYLPEPGLMRRRSQVVGQASLAESLPQLAQPVVESGSGNAHLPGDFGHGAVVQAHAQILADIPQLCRTSYILGSLRRCRPRAYSR